MTEQVEELYQEAVGQMGIVPTVFFDMTPYEVDLAYQGYLKRQEQSINNMLMAIRKALSPNAEAFNLNEELGYKRSTMSKRKETFSTLGIE